MKGGLEKYQHWNDHLNAAEIDLKSSLRMVDAILDTVRSPGNVISNPELCADIQYLADRLRFFITSRMVALNDLFAILEKHGIRGVLPEE